MEKRIEIRLAGEGGQGMILAGVILAEAAAIYDGKQVAQTQSYGPEARGGASRAEVVISDGEIDHPEVLEPNVVVVLSQEAYNKFAKNLPEECVLIVDEDRVQCESSTNLVRLPVMQLAREATSRGITANIVALGILVGLTEVVTREAIEKAIAARAPKDTLNLNHKALEAGFLAAAKVSLPEN